MISISGLVNTVLYALMAIPGYLSNFSDTPKVICNRTPLDSMGDIDYYMSVGIFGVYITIIISVPVTYMGCRRSLYNIIYGSKAQVTNPRYI